MEATEGKTKTVEEDVLDNRISGIVGGAKILEDEDSNDTPKEHNLVVDNHT